MPRFFACFRSQLCLTRALAPFPARARAHRLAPAVAPQHVAKGVATGASTFSCRGASLAALREAVSDAECCRRICAAFHKLATLGTLRPKSTRNRPTSPESSSRVRHWQDLLRNSTKLAATLTQHVVRFWQRVSGFDRTPSDVDRVGHDFGRMCPNWAELGWSHPKVGFMSTEIGSISTRALPQALEATPETATFGLVSAKFGPPWRRRIE